MAIEGFQLHENGKVHLYRECILLPRKLRQQLAKGAFDSDAEICRECWNKRIKEAKLGGTTK